MCSDNHYIAPDTRDCKMSDYKMMPAIVGTIKMCKDLHLGINVIVGTNKVVEEKVIAAV